MDLEFILKEERKVREKEVELLKVMQYFHQFGVDVNSAVKILLSGAARNPVIPVVEVERETEPSASSSEVVKSVFQEPYEMLELCEETQMILKCKQMGVTPRRAKTPSFKQVLRNPLKPFEPKEQTPLRMIGNLNPICNVTPSVFSENSMGFICTPDIFQSKRSSSRLQTPKMKLIESENDGDAKRSAQKESSPKREGVTKLNPRFDDNFLENIKSPTEPTISFQFDEKRFKNCVPKQLTPKRKKEGESPLKTKTMMNAVHSMMMYGDVNSPISPELTISLNKYRFK